MATWKGAGKGPGKSKPCAARQRTAQSTAWQCGAAVPQRDAVPTAQQSNHAPPTRIASHPQHGPFIAFGNTCNAEQQAAAFYKRTGQLLTVEEILDEEHLQKM